MASAAAVWPIRTMRLSRWGPQAMLPRTMKAIPPNIFFSVTSVLPARIARMRAASRSSYGISPHALVGIGIFFVS